MVRHVVPLALLLAAAVLSEPVTAQSPALADCNLRGAEASLKAGHAPDFRGCFPGAVTRLLRQFDYQVRETPDDRNPEVERGIVTGHDRKGRLFTLRVSSSAGHSPAPPPITAPAPDAEAVTFSISGAPTAIEGEDLTYRIERNGNDGRPHRLTLSYSDPGLLDNPPDMVVVEPSQEAVSLQLRTIVTPGDEGMRSLTVRLMDVSGGASIGPERSAHGFIEDNLKPPSYAVRPEGIVNRGDPIRFVVLRNGAPAASDIEYGISQGGVPLRADGARRLIHFAEGSTARPITVLPRVYDPCGGTVSVTLLGAPGISTRAVAPFSGMVPASCNALPADDGAADPFAIGVAADEPATIDTAGHGSWTIPGWLWISVLLLLVALFLAIRANRR